MRPYLVLPIAFALAACTDKATPAGGDSATPGIDTYEPSPDLDGDGWSELDGDCDDSDANVWPGRDEDCNGEDDNCNGVVDEGFGDSDSDGTADCQDEEECDGVDNDGDGEVDEGYPDVDGNGEPDCTDVELCDGLDNDGDGEIDEDFDRDRDGFIECEDDCDDSDAAINPDATETDGDLLDNDCDGLIDEGSWAYGDLIITEIMNNPALVTDPVGEWFEAYNGSERTLVLNGVVLYSSADLDWHQVDSEDLLLLDPGEYFVFGLDEDPFSNGGVDVGYVYADMSLANEGDEIVIEADGVVIDQVVWDDGATFPDPSGASMSLDAAFLDQDANDVGDYWCQSTGAWETGTDAGSPGEENQYCFPTALATVDSGSSLTTCDSLQLDGSASVDPEGLPLVYDWELTSAPALSGLGTSDLDTADAMNPVFVPDVAGTYVFTLSVFNGLEYSPPSVVSADITERAYNTDPTADAGQDTTYEEEVTCQSISYGVSYECPECSDYDFDLDGGGSFDLDGDWVDDPVWTITSGSASATISDDDTWTPTVTVTPDAATYGSTSSVVVEVELQVTDCMGATATDVVSLTYDCTGA